MLDRVTLLLAVVLLAFVALFVANVRKMLATPVPQPGRAPDPDQRLVARKVYDEQMQAVGESVRVTQADLVVKTAKGFALVPRSHLQEWGPDVICDDGIDWAQAHERGEAWRREHEDRLHFDKDGNLVLDREQG